MLVGYLAVWSWLLLLPTPSLAQNNIIPDQTPRNHSAQNHTCFRTESVSVKVAVPLQEPATFRSYTWCLKVPPRCSKYTVIMRERIIYQTEVRNQTVKECCSGHVTLYDVCVPACPTCLNMRCETTGKCSCKPGFFGPQCNQTCATGRWGERCLEACICRVGEDCDPVTGNCSPSTSTTSSTTTTTTTSTTTIPPPFSTSTTTSPSTKATSTSTTTNVFINLTPTQPSSSAEDLTEFNVIQSVDNDIGTSMDDDLDYPVLPTDSAIVERSDSTEVKAQWISDFEFGGHSGVTLGSVLGIIALLVVTVSVVVRCRGKKQFNGSLQGAATEKNSLHLVARNSHYAVPGPPPFSFLNGHPLDLSRDVIEDTYDHPRSIRCLVNNEPVYDELRY